MSMQGGCLCGQGRYEVEGSAFHAIKCHCRDCQLISGSGYLPLLWFQSSQIKVDEDSLKYFSRESERGPLSRHAFCAECSTPVLIRPTFDQMEVTLLVVSTLDDPSGFEPKAEIWVESAQDWDCLDSKIEHVPTQRTGKMAK